VLEEIVTPKRSANGLSAALLRVQRAPKQYLYVRAAIADLEHPEERQMTQEDKLTSDPVARFVNEALKRAGTDTRQAARKISRQTGVELEWLLRGMIKLPLESIKPMSTALGADPGELLRAWMDDYLPGLVSALQELGDPPPLSASERRLLQALRAHTEGGKAEPVVCDMRDVLAVVMV
jgi:hypothetical protein